MILVAQQKHLSKDKIQFLNNRDNDIYNIVEKQVIHPHAYGNCGIFATNLAFLMGYKRIVLLGMDLNYSDWQKSLDVGEDLSHFHPKYFDTELFDEGLTHGHPDSGSTTTKPWEETVNSINKIFHESSLSPPELVSATPNSPLNSVFKYIPFEQIIREQNEN